MRKYLDYIRSKAVRDYISSNNFQLNDYQILKIILRSTCYDLVVIHRLKECLEYLTDDMKRMISGFIDSYLDDLKKFETPEEDVVYVVQYKLSDVIGVAKTLNEAMVLIKKEELYTDDEDYDCDTLIVQKMKLGDTEYNTSEACYISHSPDNIQLITIFKDIIEDDNILGDIETAYIPIPFQEGDRVKPIFDVAHWRDWFPKNTYDPNIDYIFVAKNGVPEESIENKGFCKYPDDSFGIVWADTEKGEVYQHIHAFTLLNIDYEEDDSYVDNYSEPKYAVATELRNMQLGKRVIIINFLDALNQLIRDYGTKHFLLW